MQPKLLKASWTNACSAHRVVAADGDGVHKMKAVTRHISISLRYLTDIQTARPSTFEIFGISDTSSHCGKRNSLPFRAQAGKRKTSGVW